MVVKPRLLLAVGSALAVVLTAATPMLAATSEALPSPLRAANLLRVKDIAANGIIKPGVVAVGYQEASKPGQLYVAWSVNGGSDYRKSNGQLRRYRVVGDPATGMSLDICAGRVWVGTAWHHPSDRAGDSDVILTSRTIKGGAAQALMTSSEQDHRVRDVSVSCVSGRLIAVGWLQTNGSETTAKLLLRSVEPLGAKAAYEQTFDLGPADFGSGLSVASTPAQVAVAFVRNGDLRLHRLTVEDGRAGLASQKTIVWQGVSKPRLATKLNRLAVVYSDAGKVKAKLSKDRGVSLSKPYVLASTGGTRNPSYPYSVDVVGGRVVTTAAVYTPATGKTVSKRISSSDFGRSWNTLTFGNRGARVDALLKVKGQPTRLMEAWHNNAPQRAADTLRARYEY
jgi:hypothetical protein